MLLMENMHAHGALHDTDLNFSFVHILYGEMARVNEDVADMMAGYLDFWIVFNGDSTCS